MPFTVDKRQDLSIKTRLHSKNDLIQKLFPLHLILKPTLLSYSFILSFFIDNNFFLPLENHHSHKKQNYL